MGSDTTTHKCKCSTTIEQWETECQPCIKAPKVRQYELRSIDAWRECEGGWTWNDTCCLDRSISISDDDLTPRKIFRLLRDLDHLSEWSKGRVSLQDAWPILEIQNKNTGEPVFALMTLEY